MHLPLRKGEKVREVKGEKGEREARGYRVEKEGEREAKRDNFKRKMSVRD